jgi:hypothetical protein
VRIHIVGLGWIGFGGRIASAEVDDAVVAVAVAVGFGDGESEGGGFEGEGEFGQFSAAFGGEFAVRGELREGGA